MAWTVQVGAAVPSSVCITSSAAAVSTGEAFTLSSSVSASTTDGLPGGTVALYDGTIPLGVFNLQADVGDTAARAQLTVKVATVRSAHAIG